MKNISFILLLILSISFSSYGQTQSGCTITFPGNYNVNSNFSSIYTAASCPSGDVIFANFNSKPSGGGKVTFDTDITLNSLTVNFANGTQPAELIIPSGVTLTVTDGFTFTGQPAKDKFLTVEGDLSVGGTLDFGSVEFEIDGLGTIDAMDIIGADDVSCADADGGSGTCPLVTAETCDDDTNDFCTTSVTPIDLAFFDAKGQKNDVLLTWATYSEENNDYFTLERSSNGLEFHELTRVEGAGNSLEVLNYQFEDKNPYPGVSYYRLKQTDYDGTNETFNVVAAEYYGTVTPVTVRQQIEGMNELVIYNNMDEENIAYLYDMTGRGGKVGVLKVGENNISTDKLNIRSGIYTLKVVNSLGKMLTTQKFVVQ